jgi:hypothetical protein
MKLKQFITAITLRNETVARFGTARLVREPRGRFQLVGGTTEDRSAAREWASLFLHEAVLTERQPTFRFAITQSEYLNSK